MRIILFNKAQQKHSCGELHRVPLPQIMDLAAENNKPAIC
jgi:hypothetical protein